MSLGSSSSSTLLPGKPSKIEIVDNKGLLALKSLIRDKKRDIGSATSNDTTEGAVDNSSSQRLASVLTTKYLKNKFKEAPKQKYSSNNLYKRSTRSEPFEKINKGIEERNMKDDFFAAEELRRRPKSSVILLEPNEGADIDDSCGEDYFDRDDHNDDDDDDDDCSNRDDKVGSTRIGASGLYHHILGPDPKTKSEKQYSANLFSTCPDASSSKSSRSGKFQLDRNDGQINNGEIDWERRVNRKVSSNKGEINGDGANWRHDLDATFKESMFRSVYGEKGSN